MSSIPVTLNPAGTPALEVPQPSQLDPAESALSDAGAQALIAHHGLAQGAGEDQLDYLENRLRPSAAVGLWALYSTVLLASTAVAIAAWRLIHG